MRLLVARLALATTANAFLFAPLPAPGVAVSRRMFSDDDLVAEVGLGGDQGWKAAPSTHHGYKRGDPDGAAVDLRRVDEILTARAAAKRDRDFVVADALRDDLRRECNVVVNDRERMWRVWTPGGSWGPRKPEVGRSLPTDHGLARDENDASDIDVAAVDALLLARLQAKYKRDFAEADALREKLAAVHGVRVHDAKKTWKGGVARGTADPWARTEDVYARAGEFKAPVDAEKIQSLIARRAVARRRKHWDMADGLLEELYGQGVVVDDKRREYRAVVAYACRSPGRADEAAVAALVAERALLRERKKFRDADELRARILDEYDVQIDDQKLVWWAVDRA